MRAGDGLQLNAIARSIVGCFPSDAKQHVTGWAGSTGVADDVCIRFLISSR